jgi:hypothetical protein
MSQLHEIGKRCDDVMKSDPDGMVGVLVVRSTQLAILRADVLPVYIVPTAVSIVKDIQCTKVHPTNGSVWTVSMIWRWRCDKYEEVEAAVRSIAPKISLRIIRTGADLSSPELIDRETAEMASLISDFMYCGKPPPMSSCVVPSAEGTSASVWPVQS